MLFASLQQQHLLAPVSQLISYATPRRLAVSISQVRVFSPDQTVREKVLPVAIALNEAGEPTPLLIKKLATLAQTRGCTLPVLADLERAPDGKTESFFYTYQAAGISLQHGLQTALHEAVQKLPVPKMMSYQRPDGTTEHFVRPAHRLLLCMARRLFRSRC